MFVVYQLPTNEYVYGNVPEECYDTNLAKQWGLHTAIGQLCSKFWVLDTESYLRDFKSHGKRSSIDLYLVIVHESEEYARCAGVTDIEGYNELISRFPGQIEKIGIELNKHCLDWYDPELNELEIEVSEIIDSLCCAEEE